MQGKRGEKKAGAAIYVRLPVDIVENLDEWVEELRTSVPGGTGITRSDVIRDLVVLAIKERRAKKSKAKR
jgi:Arc/MetJ-type ribon-helix-helix transcriptional regulator